MIKLFWRLLLVCIALAIVSYGIAFSYYNSQELSIDLVFSQLPAIPSGLLILASLLIGFCLAFLVFSFSIGRLKIRHSLVKSKLAKLRQQSAETDKAVASKPTSSKVVAASLS